MKDFNLDNLEKKMPYKIPENFFEEMQENVLAKTTLNQKKSAKIFTLNFAWATGIAAALALIFGVMFLFNNLEKPNVIENTVVKNAQKTENITPESTEISSDNLAVENHETQIIQEINTTESNVEKPEIITKSSENLAVNELSKITEVNVDEVLGSLSDSELAELSQNNEQDIYLELYN